MASYNIIGNLQRTGFVDKAGSGSNGQVRTYFDGIEMWADVGSVSLNLDVAITSKFDGTVMTQKTNGNILSFQYGSD